MLKIILPAFVCITAAAVYRQPAYSRPEADRLHVHCPPLQKIYRDSIYIDSKAIPVAIHENAWMMMPPTNRKDSAAAKKMGIADYAVWRRNKSPRHIVPEILPYTEDGRHAFYIPPAQARAACRRFTVWGNYCILKLPAGFSGVSLTNTMYLAFSNSTPADTLTKLLRQYRLQITSQGNGPGGVYATSFRRGEQIARISRKLRRHPFVENITNYLGNQAPTPLDRQKTAIVRICNLPCHTRR